MLETKALLVLIANAIQKADSLKEAYDVVKETANADGLILPEYKEKM